MNFLIWSLLNIFNEEQSPLELQYTPNILDCLDEEKWDAACIAKAIHWEFIINWKCKEHMLNLNFGVLSIQLMWEL